MTTTTPLPRPNQQKPQALSKILDTAHSNLVGGTAWLWSRLELAEAVDVLVVDEAGQFSLANALAVAQGARSLVLLGDPQQLGQPSQGIREQLSRPVDQDLLGG